MAYQEPPPAVPGYNGAPPAAAAYPPGPGGYPPNGYAPSAGYPPSGDYYSGPQGAPGYGEPYDAGSAEGYHDEGAACDEGCATGHGAGFGLAPVFFGAEWLLWERHGQDVPVLVSTSPAGTAPAAAGILDQGGIPVFGGGRIDDGFVPGFRVTSGIWLDPNHEFAFGARVFVLDQDKTTFVASSPAGQPIIARPFLDVSDPMNPTEAAFVVAFDDGNPATDPRSGDLTAQVTSDLWGGDIFSSVMLTTGAGYRVDIQGGYQYYRIDEAVAIRSTSVQGEDFFGDNIPNQTVLALEDVFDTQNEFHGGALGFLTELQQGCFSLKLLTRCAIGNMNQRVRVAGSTTITPPPPAMGPPFPPVVFPGGVLTQPSNIGESERDRTTLVPEGAITAGYNFTPNLSFTLGYSIIYWNHVAQAGPHIDRRIDPTQATPFPERVLVDTDFWVMGLNGGMEWRY
jgi:hypothetical protein